MIKILLLVLFFQFLFTNVSVGQTTGQINVDSKSCEGLDVHTVVDIVAILKIDGKIKPVTFMEKVKIESVLIKGSDCEISFFAKDNDLQKIEYAKKNLEARFSLTEDRGCLTFDERNGINKALDKYDVEQ